MWLNLRNFFILAQISPKKVPNHNPKQYALKKKRLSIAFGIFFLGDLSQIKKLSEIKPPLKGRVAPSSALHCSAMNFENSYSKMSIKRLFLLNGLVLNFL